MAKILYVSASVKSAMDAERENRNSENAKLSITNIGDETGIQQVGGADKANSLSEESSEEKKLVDCDPKMIISDHSPELTQTINKTKDSKHCSKENSPPSSVNSNSSSRQQTKAEIKFGSSSKLSWTELDANEQIGIRNVIGCDVSRQGSMDGDSISSLPSEIEQSKVKSSKVKTYGKKVNANEVHSFVRAIGSGRSIKVILRSSIQQRLYEQMENSLRHLQKHYKETHALESVVEDEVYGFCQKNETFRVRLNEHATGSCFNIYLIDFGKKQVCHRNNLFDLPEGIRNSTVFSWTAFLLKNITAYSSISKGDCDQIIECVSRKLSDQQIIVKRDAQKHVELYIEQRNLNKEILNLLSTKFPQLFKTSSANDKGRGKHNQKPDFVYHNYAYGLHEDTMKTSQDYRMYGSKQTEFPGFSEIPGPKSKGLFQTYPSSNFSLGNHSSQHSSVQKYSPDNYAQFPSKNYNFSSSYERFKENNLSCFALETVSTQNSYSKNIDYQGYSDNYDSQDILQQTNRQQQLYIAEREVEKLRSLLKSRDKEIEDFKKENIPFRLTDICSLVRLISRKRSEINCHICNQSILNTTIQFLLEDQEGGFHADYDHVLQVGADITKHGYANRTNKSSSSVYNFFALLHPLCHEEIYTQLSRHLSKVKETCKDIQEHEEKYKSEFKYSSQFPKSFAKIIDEFNIWKGDYMKAQEYTNEVVQNSAAFCRNFGQYLLDALKGKVGKTPDSFYKLENVNCAVLTEERHAMKQSLLHSAVLATIDEIKLRMKKITDIRSLLRQMPTIDAVKCRSPDSERKFTLLSFISKSGDMSPQMKCRISADILNELQIYHEEEGAFRYLNPENILIEGEGDIKLAPSQSIVTHEPVPPWTFMAPEWASHKSPFSVTTKTTPDLTGDMYSFAQLVLWLACLNASAGFGNKYNQLKGASLLLTQALDKKPQSRPTLAEFKSGFNNLCFAMFGEVFLDEIDHDVAVRIPSGTLGQFSDKLSSNVTILSHTNREKPQFNQMLLEPTSQSRFMPSDFLDEDLPNNEAEEQMARERIEEREEKDKHRRKMNVEEKKLFMEMQDSDEDIFSDGELSDPEVGLSSIISKRFSKIPSSALET